MPAKRRSRTRRRKPVSVRSSCHRSDAGSACSPTCRHSTEVTRLVFSEAPDVVHTHTAKAGTVGRLAACLFNITRRRSRRCFVVHTYHGHVFEGYFGTAASRAIRTVERCLASITHRIVTISPAQRHDIVERFRVAPAGRTTTIPLGLALEPLLVLQPGAPDLRERLGLGTGEVVVGFLGRMVPIKDLPTLIHAFAMALERMPNMRLLLAGDGPERPVLTQLAERLGIEGRVVFPGWVDDLPRFYATLDVCALSSINEGTPVAIIEAMAAARPVAACRSGRGRRCCRTGCHWTPGPAPRSDGTGERARDVVLGPGRTTAHGRRRPTACYPVYGRASRRRSRAAISGRTRRGAEPELAPGRGQRAAHSNALHVRIHHHLDQLLEIDLRFPSEHALRLRRIADEVIDFRRPEELRIDPDVLLPVESDAAERDARPARAPSG